MNTLVGYTGFVGSNLCQQTSFDLMYNSSNIQDAFRENHGLLVYSGVRAEKFLANQNPAADRQHIETTIGNIQKLRFQKLILISTIDVILDPSSGDESKPVVTDGLHAYGANRRMLEEWVIRNVPDAHIVRLPALFGKGLKKNFLFDIKNPAPSMLKADRFASLAATGDISLADYYADNGSGFYAKKTLTSQQTTILNGYFSTAAFNSLCFTDSRSSFQFYNLDYLWKHLQLIVKSGISLAQLVTEPVSAAEIYHAHTGKDFRNEVATNPANYNLKTLFAEQLGGANGYLFNKNQVLAEIGKFLQVSV